MIHLYSGDGKGKTSIATGMAVRAAGAGRSVTLARFMKGGESAELAPLKKLGVRVIEAEKKFPFFSQMTEADLSQPHPGGGYKCDTFAGRKRTADHL